MNLNYRIIKHLLWISGLLLSLMLGSLAVRNYLYALPVAEGNLRGIALSISSSVEALSRRDPSLNILHELKNNDIAFFSVIDENGVQVFHSNHELEGTVAEDFDFRPDSYPDGYYEDRLVLGTGEIAFEFACPLHFSDRTFILRLVLHTYRADAIVRRARMGMIVIFSLMAASWIMGIFIYRLAVRAERQRKEMERKENLARLGTMGAVLAHEVRNPLAGIKGYAQLLEERLPDDEKKSFAGLIVTEALRLERLVNDLLAYAREDRSEPVPVKAADIVRDVLDLVENTASDMKIEIRADVDDKLVILGDRDRIIQILLNLVQNAVQSMPDGGIAGILAFRSGSTAIIEVTDTGTGMDKDIIESIFEPFYTTKARGSGFGLALSRKYAEEMKGEIRVISSKGQGSSFRLVLPAGRTQRG